MYVFVVGALRMMGKRQIGDMQPNELVVTILISEIAALPIQDIDQPVVNGVVSMFVLVILEVILSALSLKWSRARTFLNGRPTILINDGVIDQRAMKRVRVTIDDLLSGLRQQNIFNIDDVRYAIMETNGQLSVMLREERQPVTVEQADATPEGIGLSVPVVCDGRKQSQFMQLTGISEQQLRSALRDKGVQVSDVFLMTIDSKGNAYMVKRGDGT